MKYRAVIKQDGQWWIGWLVDLHGVNAQERTKEELLKSLRIGAEDLLDLKIPAEQGEIHTIIEIPEHRW